MPRVNTVKSARKDYPGAGIKKGDTYYWWSFNFGPTIKSKTYPKRSQLTRSDFLAQIYDIEDEIGELGSLDSDVDTLRSNVEEIIDKIRTLGEECQEKLDNMPEHLQESSASGETLQNRVDYCEEWASELEAVDLDNIEVDPSDIDDDDPELNEEDELELAKEELAQNRQQENFEEAVNELSACTYNGE